MEERSEQASIAAYDLPELLGPVRIVSGRRRMVPLDMGPKSLMVMVAGSGVRARGACVRFWRGGHGALAGCHHI
ncbi:MAG: hypothetical protein MPJ06_03880 [Nitrosopumilus sp.]|nr:hypothetical protein [Nitrosopumilus sp.]